MKPKTGMFWAREERDIRTPYFGWNSSGKAVIMWGFVPSIKKRLLPSSFILKKAFTTVSGLVAKNMAMSFNSLWI